MPQTDSIGLSTSGQTIQDIANGKAATLAAEATRTSDPKVKQDLLNKVAAFRKIAGSNTVQAAPVEQADPYKDYAHVVQNPDGTILGQRPGSTDWETITPNQSQPADTTKQGWWQPRPGSDFFKGAGLDTDAIGARSSTGSKAAEVAKQLGKGLYSYGKASALDPFQFVEAPVNFMSGQIEKAIQDKNMAELAGALTSVYMAKEPTEKVAGSFRTPTRVLAGVGDTAAKYGLKEANDAADKVTEENRVNTGRQVAGQLHTGIAGQLADSTEALRRNVRTIFDNRWAKLKETIGNRPVLMTPVANAIAQAQDFLGSPELIKQFDSIMKKVGLVGKDAMDNESGLRARASSPAIIDYPRAQDHYTMLGDEIYGGSGPDFDKLYHAQKMVRDALGEQLGKTADMANAGSISNQLRFDYRQFKEAFDDRNGPLRQLIDAETSDKKLGVLKKFSFDDTINQLLDKYGAMAGRKDLGGQSRILTRMSEALPNAGDQKPVPNVPNIHDWTVKTLQDKAKSFSGMQPYDIAPYRILSGFTALKRGMGKLLDQPWFQEWLAKR